VLRAALAGALVITAALSVQPTPAATAAPGPAAPARPQAASPQAASPAAAAAPAAATATTAFAVVNAWTGKCMETTASVRNDNANVAQRTCSPAATQQWLLDELPDGHYRIVNRNSGKDLSTTRCGTEVGTNVVQSATRAGACQQWRVTPAGEGWVRIDDRNSGLALDVMNCYPAEDANIRLWTWLDNDCQRWRLQPVGQVTITNVNNGRALDVTDCRRADHTPVTTRAQRAGACQQWTWEPIGRADYRVRAARADTCLSVVGASVADGAAVEQRACSSTALDQRWYLEPQAGTAFRMVNRGSGRSLEVARCELGEGSPVGQWGRLDNNCQRFRIAAFPALGDHQPVGPVYPNPRPVAGDTERVHDPAIIKRNGTYLLFTTGPGLDIRTSRDGRTYTKIGSVFPDGAPWADKYLPATGIRNLWAPDITFRNGQYYLYYAASSFGSRHSALFLATSKTGMPGTWTHRGTVHETVEGGEYNAIDANLIIDSQSRWWLAFGSFWGGIKMIRIDPKTGLRYAADPTLYPLASRPFGTEGAIEAPFVYRHGTYFYLFVSFDYCCRGDASTYRIMVGRSKNATGPYLDRDGKPMTEGGGTQLLAAHDAVPGPGHQAIFNDGSGTDLLVYHYYGDNDRPDLGRLGINALKWDSAAWPYVG
jgi:arabinan endo-1,5-alpha-L-arabinosidase